MLFILFGSTVEMGRWSRRYFENQQFEIIYKYNYIPDNSVMQDRFGKWKKSSKEKVLECDFIYETNGILLGFNKEQIMDAVRGYKRCLLTISSATIDFIRQIKAAYGDYVTVIGTYIDERTLRRLFEALPDITSEELKRRTITGGMVKKNLLEDRKLFDDIVIYGGEDSAFNYESLSVQYGYILEKAEKREKELNDKMYVEMPYTGNENYIFVSYAHLDMERIFPILRKLQLAGCRIWYDEGISGGENWRKILASKIQSDQCRNFVLFSSSNSTRSRHVQAEINAALNCDKKIITVRLDDSKFGLDTEMYLLTYQILFASDSNIEEELLHSIEETVKIRNSDMKNEELKM